MYLYLGKREIKKLVNGFRPTKPRMEALSVYLHGQVMNRFKNHGSPDKPWKAPKWRTAIGADDGRAILTGPTGHLLMSFAGTSAYGEAEVWSDSDHALIHQLGTRGAGGVLPDIKPKRAKALFIPLTDRAERSTRLTGSAAAYVRQKGGMKESEAPIRAGVRMRKALGTKLGAMVFMPLVKGRIKNGKLQRWNEKFQRWEDGKPDFLLLKVSRVPPRPMLPDSETEQAQQTRFIVDLLSGGKPTLKP